MSKRQLPAPTFAPRTPLRELLDTAERIGSRPAQAFARTLIGEVRFFEGRLADECVRAETLGKAFALLRVSVPTKW